MFLELLSFSPLIALVWAASLIISLTIHEFAHALIGKQLGDTTAEEHGRLTLNPLAHLDPAGTLALFILGFGWAKPVPFNPYRLKSIAKDSLLIALAGPLSNLILAVAAGLLAQTLLSMGLGFDSLLLPFLLFLTLTNLLLGFFNLLPVPPLDGAKFVNLAFYSLGWTSWQNAFDRYGNMLLLVLVAISLLTPANPFSFISTPAFALCDLFVGSSCGGLFSTIFGG